MPTGVLADIIGGGLDLVPPIEAAVLEYAMRNYTMAQRVSLYTDQTGFNIRQIAQWNKYRRAQTVAEGVEATSEHLIRSRKAVMQPLEKVTQYALSKQRLTSDSVSNIIVDVTKAIGGGLGDAAEADLIAAAGKAVRVMGSPSVAFTENMAVQVKSMFATDARRDPIHCVIHPLQQSSVMEGLYTFVGTNAGVNTSLREQALAGFSLPKVPGVDFVPSDFLPRKIINKLSVFGTSGTFRLALFDGQVIGTNVTAAISSNATHGTVATNIKAALEALTFTGNGTWTVTSDALTNITITPPSTLYLDRDSELRIAVNMTATSHTQWGEKSAYDLVVSPSGGPLDINGVMKGVEIYERSASAKAFMFTNKAIFYDLRQAIQIHQSMSIDGRTAFFTGTGVWAADVQDYEQLWAIETLCSSPNAVGA